MSQIDEPNVRVALAASFNQRGSRGFTQAVTNSDDQVKLNSIYEPHQNPLGGRTTLYLSKRPGVSSLPADYGATNQHPYLHDLDPGTTGRLLIYRDATSTIAHNGSASTLITSGAMSPRYLDRIRIQNDDYAVLQLDTGAGSQLLFYGNDITNISTEVSTLTFTPRGKLEFIDGFSLLASFDGRIFNSDLNTISSWPASGWIDRRTAQDSMQGLARFGQQIIAFGSATMEVYRNAGTPIGSPLEAVPSLSQEYGLMSQGTSNKRHYYTIVLGHLFWCSEHPRGVFAYNGASVEKVSNVAVDKIIMDTSVNYVSRLCVAGQIAVVIGLNNATETTQRALLFFPEWKEWFIWESTRFTPMSSLREDDVFMGVTGSTSDKLLSFLAQTENYQDQATNYQWLHQFKLPKPGNGFQKMDMFGLQGDTASSALDINVQFSDDDYASLTTTRTIDMTSHKKAIYRCGGYRTPRAVRLSYTGSQPVRIEAAIARIE